MLQGAVLAMCHRLFPQGIPSLSGFAAANEVSPSTFRRAADGVLELLRGFLETRKPGPTAAVEDASPEREEAVKKLTDLYRWLEDQRLPTATNQCLSPEAKQRVAAVAEEVRALGVLGFAEIATMLELNERQLRRIRHEVQATGGTAPTPMSRRPHTIHRLPEELRERIRFIQASADNRDPYTAADVKRILERRYTAELLKYHGSETISVDTVQKYMKPEEQPEPKEHPRGSYVYPESFQEVAIDTSHFKVFGVTFYLIVILDIGSRLNLVTRVFLRENTAAVVSALEEYLEAFPGVGVVVIDRGSPYRNEEVKRLLEEHGKIRLVCPRATPTAKAACERNFLTLKNVLAAALSRVLPENPGWPREWLQKVIEMGVVVFQKLHPLVPQDSIDGKSPLERANQLNASRAWSRMTDLHARAMRSEPAEEIAEHIHDRFQLPGPRKETVKRLAHYGSRALRRVLEVLADTIGPPHPPWLRDPLGYISVRAKRIAETEHLDYFRKQRDKEQRKERVEEERLHQANLTCEGEHPERFVDETLEQAIRFMDLRIPGAMRLRLHELGELLRSLSQKMGRAFDTEIARISERVDKVTENETTRQRMHEWLAARAFAEANY